MYKFSRLWGTTLCLLVCHSAYGQEDAKPATNENSAVWHKLEKQFSQYVTWRHEGINTEKSASGTITTIKNPHLIIHRPGFPKHLSSGDLEAWPPFEAYIDGTLALEESARHDNFKITPKGTIHLEVRQQKDKPPIHVVVTGDIVNTIEGDFNALQGNIEQSQWWISFLEALKANRWQMKNLQASVLTPEPKMFMSLPSLSMEYTCTPLSKAQQEISLTFNDKADFIYSSPLDTDLSRNKFIAFSMPEMGKTDDSFQIKITMPSWKDLFASISEASQHESPLSFYAQNSFPELSIQGNSQHDNNLMKGTSSGALTFNKGDDQQRVWKLTANGSYQNNLDTMESARSSFLNKFAESSEQGDKAKTVSNTDNFINDLIKSQGFLKLLHLVPIQATTDFNLSFQHDGQKHPLENPKVDFSYSFLTGTKAGVRIDAHFKEGFNGLLDLYNKRLVMESLEKTYNAIGEIITSFDPDSSFVPVTDLQMQQLQQLLQNYSDTPDKDDSDLKLSAKLNDQGTVLIGGKDSDEFMQKIAAIMIAPQPPLPQGSQDQQDQNKQ